MNLSGFVSLSFIDEYILGQWLLSCSESYFTSYIDFYIKALFDSSHVLLITVLGSYSLEYCTLKSFMTVSCGVLFLHVCALFGGVVGGEGYVFSGLSAGFTAPSLFSPHPTIITTPSGEKNECAYNVYLGSTLFSIFIIYETNFKIA